MTATSNELAGAARSTMQAQESAINAVMLCARGDVARAQDAAQDAADKSATVAEHLLAAGVPREAFDGIPDPSPLELDQLDVPEARALLAELRPLVALAERLDEARGRSMPDAPHGTIKGCDIAEMLGNLVARLDLEVNGAHGRD